MIELIRNRGIVVRVDLAFEKNQRQRNKFSGVKVHDFGAQLTRQNEKQFAITLAFHVQCYREHSLTETKGPSSFRLIQ